MANVDLNAPFVAQAAEDNNSKKPMKYQSDTGAEYLVNITENIGEAFGFDDYVTADGNLPNLPTGWSMRKVRFVDSTGKIAGEYPCGKPTTPIFNEGGLITVPRKGKAAGVNCAVTSAIGERRRFLTTQDTGQQSGDNT